MIAVIGEKPSVARDIVSRYLGVRPSCRFGNAGSIRHTEFPPGKSAYYPG